MLSTEAYGSALPAGSGRMKEGDGLHRPEAWKETVAALEARGHDFGRLRAHPVAAAAREDWPALCALLAWLAGAATPWPGQLEQVRLWYAPHLERLYDSPQMRAADLDVLEQLSATFE